MPTKTMAVQTGNSCAAHCLVIAIAELFDTNHNMTKIYAEGTVWPEIQFVPQIVGPGNSDPRRIVTFANGTGGGEAVAARVIRDNVRKNIAIGRVAPAIQPNLDLLFGMMGGDVIDNMPVVEGIYYNNSYLMFNNAVPTPASYTGMHNILVTRFGNRVYYYNSNEAVPAWTALLHDNDWLQFNGQNAGTHSYVFTGVTVELSAKV